MSFVVKDSGERQVFSGGMMRDVQTGKLDIWRVFVGPLVERLADHLTKGATKYPDVTPLVPNWTLAAGPEEMARFKASAARHFWQWFNNVSDEDHFAATVFNMNGFEETKRKLEADQEEPGCICPQDGSTCWNCTSSSTCKLSALDDDIPF